MSMIPTNNNSSMNHLMQSQQQQQIIAAAAATLGASTGATTHTQQSAQQQPASGALSTANLMQQQTPAGHMQHQQQQQSGQQNSLLTNPVNAVAASTGYYGAATAGGAQQMYYFAATPGGGGAYQLYSPYATPAPGGNLMSFAAASYPPALPASPTAHQPMSNQQQCAFVYQQLSDVIQHQNQTAPASTYSSNLSRSASACSRQSVQGALSINTHLANQQASALTTNGVCKRTATYCMSTLRVVVKNKRTTSEIESRMKQLHKSLKLAGREIIGMSVLNMNTVCFEFVSEDDARIALQVLQREGDDLEIEIIQTAEKDLTNVYVCNLPTGDNFQEGNLVELFQEYGEIKSYKLIKTGNNPCGAIGFIRFASHEHAKEAIKQLNSGLKCLAGQTKNLYCKYANKKLKMKDDSVDGSLCSSSGPLSVGSTLSRCHSVDPGAMMSAPLVEEAAQAPFYQIPSPYAALPICYQTQGNNSGYIAIPQQLNPQGVYYSPSLPASGGSYATEAAIQQVPAYQNPMCNIYAAPYGFSQPIGS